MQTDTTNKRAAEVLALGEIFAGVGGVKVARETIADGGDALMFHRRLAERVNSVGSFDQALGLHLSQRDLTGYSLVNVITGARGLEREVAADIGRMAGVVKGSGTLIPWSVLSRDFTIAAASEAGNLAHGAAKATEYLRDPLRAQLSLARLGALITPGFTFNFSVPRFGTDAAVGFTSAETGATGETQPGSALVAFNASRIGGFIDVSKQSLLQSGPLLESWLRRVLGGIVAAQLESAGINGSGSGGNPLGIRSTPGIQSVLGGTNGALLNWGHITDLENAPGLANAPDTELGGYLTNTKVRKHCKTTQRAAGLPFIWDNTPTPLNGYRAAITSNVPSNLTKGTSSGVCSSVIYSSDWSMLLIPIFGAPEILVDHRTQAINGFVRIHINAWVASGLLHPAIFAVMDDALTA